jgi:hypothetical protein
MQNIIKYACIISGASTSVISVGSADWKGWLGTGELYILHDFCSTPGTYIVEDREDGHVSDRNIEAPSIKDI